ncbi:MAG: hypothetical protein ABW123_09860 [Cystobacter sp.]
MSWHWSTSWMHHLELLIVRREALAARRDYIEELNAAEAQFQWAVGSTQ